MIPLENVYSKVITHFILLFLSFLKTILNRQPPLHLSLIRLPISYYGPSFFKHTFKIREFHLHPYTTKYVEAILNYQKRDPVRKKRL